MWLVRNRKPTAVLNAIGTFSKRDSTGRDSDCSIFRACQGLVAVSNLNQACLNFVEWDWDAKTRDSLVVYGVVQRT